MKIPRLILPRKIAVNIEEDCRYTRIKRITANRTVDTQDIISSVILRRVMKMQPAAWNVAQTAGLGVLLAVDFL